MAEFHFLNSCYCGFFVVSFDRGNKPWISKLFQTQSCLGRLNPLFKKNAISPPKSSSIFVKLRLAGFIWNGGIPASLHFARIAFVMTRPKLKGESLPCACFGTFLK